MKSTRTLKRLGSIGLVTGVLAAMAPFIGVTAASATTGSITLLDPQTGNVSTQPNGTDAVVHLYADVLQSTSPSPNLVSAQFTAQDFTTSGPTVVIATAPINAKPTDTLGNNADAVATWTPATPGDTYKVTVNAIDANNAVVPASTGLQTVVTSNTAHSLRITRPANDSLFGYYATTGKLNIAGTATATTDSVSAKDDSAASSSAVFSATTQNWADDITPVAADIPTAGAAGQKSVADINATNNTGVVTTHTPGTSYLQAFDPTNGFNLTPSNQFSTTGVPKPYAIQTLDQHGNPISGLPFDFTITDPNNNGSVTLAIFPTNGTQTPVPTGFPNGTAVQHTTDQFGQFRFTISDSDNETVQIQAKSKFTGTFNAATDFTRNATFTTAQQIAASGTATVVGHPTAPLYASQTYGVGPANGDGGSTPGTDAGPTPGILVNLKDANNQSVPNANVQYQYTRNIAASTRASCGSDTATYPLTVGPFTSVNTDNSGNLTIFPSLPKCTSEAGTDAFTVYLEKNGSPGFQSGGDTLIGNVTLAFGPEKIYFLPCDMLSSYVGGPNQTCKAQQKAGVDKTVSILAVIFDGTANQPITGRKIDISLSAANPGTAGVDYGFSPSNNSGLTTVTTTQGDITTDVSGKSSVTLFDNRAELLTVTASDPTLGGVLSEDATDGVSFRNYSAVLNSTSSLCDADPTDTSCFNLGAEHVGQVSPLNGGSPVGAPGQPLTQGFVFKDQQGAPLANEVFTVRTTKGFFTDLPNVGAGDRNYTDLHFDTPITDGQLVKGDLHSNGTTATIVTNAAGEGYWDLGILTDPHFLVDGTASGTVTGQLNGAGATQNLASQVLFATDGTAYNVEPLNPGQMKLQQGRFDNNNRFQLIGGAPSGPKATSNKSTIPVDEVDTVEIQTDSFGNFVSEPFTVSSTGPGNPQNGGRGAFANIVGATGGSGFAHTFITDDTNPPADVPQTGAQSVAFDWSAVTDTFQTNTTTHQVEVNTNNQDVTNNYGVNWYNRNPASFRYKMHFTPRAKVRAGTPIGFSISVIDARGRAVGDLGVEFVRNGPKGQTQDTGNPATCTNQGCTDGLFTDVHGRAGFLINSTKVGPFTVHTILSDTSGNELQGRPPAAHGKFKGPHHHKKKHHHHKKKKH